jgi:hypothetical protein
MKKVMVAITKRTGMALRSLKKINFHIGTAED